MRWGARVAAGAGVFLPLCASLAFGQAGDRQLQVVVSGEQLGYLTPCGCSKPLVGGMPRRGAALRSLLSPGGAGVLLENGDLTPARGRQDELKAETLVDMLSLLRYDALNLGELDFRLGLPYLESLKARFSGALLCGNARVAMAEGDRPFAAQCLVTRSLGGRRSRLALVGVLSPSYAAEVASACPGVTLEDPSVTLARLPEAEAEVRILLYHGPMEELRRLVRRFPRFHLAVAAHEGYAGTMGPSREGETLLVAGGARGKQLTEVDFPAGSGKAGEPLTHTLGPEVPEDPAVLQLRAAYQQRVLDEGLLDRISRSPSPGAYAGSTACSRCHAAAHQTWRGSAHSRALETLTRDHQDRDPECVQCHVVGLDRQGGFTSLLRTPDLAGVGCESCHGPAAAHAADPKLALTPAARSCGSCHVPEHSPGFDYEKYWARIRH